MTQQFNKVDRAVRDALTAETEGVRAGDGLLQRIQGQVDTVSQHERRPARWAVAAVVLLVLAATVGSATLTGRPDDKEVTAGPSGNAPSTLPAPAVGEASAERLEDGTPVWVVHHDDGTVSVLDAPSAHRPFGFGQLVGWCASSRGFEDPQHGSHYDERGRYRAGPAPTGLSVYPTSPLEGGTVTVTGPAAPQPPGRVQGGKDSDPAVGSGCSDGSVDPDYVPGYRPGSAEPHSIRTEPGLTVGEAMDRPAGEMVVIRDAPILIVAGQPAVVCEGAVQASAPPRCDGPEAPGLFLPVGLDWALVEGSFVARVIDGTLRDIAFVKGWTVQEGGG